MSNITVSDPTRSLPGPNLACAVLSNVLLLGTLLLGTQLLVTPVAAEDTGEALPAELLEAGKVAILGLEMDFALRSRFTRELEEWERFELVLFPDEADICMALSTRPDYTQETVESGAPDAKPDEDNPLSKRAQGTMRVVDKLYFKVFVSGGDDLWSDEIDLGEDNEAAAELVRRLRERIEQQENGDG